MAKPSILVLALAAAAPAAQAASIDLAGPDGTGYLSMSNVKSWSSAPDPVTQSPFPYYFDPVANLYRSIAAVPLSASSVYAEEASYTVVNKVNTQADFSAISAATIGYGDGGLTGTGTETIGVGDLSFSFNNAAFSPKGSAYNTGGGFGNFGWRYTITASDVAGAGLTFVDGVLSSIDLMANIGITAYFGDTETGAARWRTGSGTTSSSMVYEGSLSITGNRYAFDLDQTQSPYSLFGQIQDTRMVFNRSGSIAGVTAVPEPGTYALMLCGLGIVGLFAQRRREPARAQG